MKYFLILLFFLSYQGLAKDISEEEFARVIALKGDDKKLPDAFSMYTISPESTTHFRYEYSAEKIQEVKTTNKIWTVEGKYLVVQAYAKQFDVTAYYVVYWDDATKSFIAGAKFPDRPILQSKGKVVDKTTLSWVTKTWNGGVCKALEKVSGKIITTTEKYYDKNNKYTHSGSFVTTYK